MRGRSSHLITAVLVVAGLVAPALPAAAAPGVTINASDQWLTYGESTTISGRVDPAASGETVQIVDKDGIVRGEDTTDAQGRYAVTFAPRRNMRVHAEWLTHSSPGIDLHVRAILSVTLGSVRLFDSGKVRGLIRPRVSVGEVEITLMRNGSPYKRKVIRPAEGRFGTGFRIGKPGTYRARVRYSGGNHAPGRARSDTASPLTPSLGVGSRSLYVRSIEGRLMDLGYKLGRVNRKYDGTTADAVRAFNKVQGTARVGTVSASTWHALASPRIPRPRFRRPGYHIEVDQTRQVLYRVRRGRVITVLHVSTGAGGATRDGTFTFYRRLSGYSPNRLYHPVYFDGLRAIHGWPEVPTYPASHGCVRVPMWAAEWIASKVELGDKIRIYH